MLICEEEFLIKIECVEELSPKSLKSSAHIIIRWKEVNFLLVSFHHRQWHTVMLRMLKSRALGSIRRNEPLHPCSLELGPVYCHYFCKVHSSLKVYVFFYNCASYCTNTIGITKANRIKNKNKNDVDIECSL